MPTKVLADVMARLLVDWNHGDELKEKLIIRRVWFIFEQMMLNQIIAFLKHQFLAKYYHFMGTH